MVIVEIIKKEFYQIRQDKRMLGVSIAAPILQILLLGYAATTDIKNSNLVVCDMDRTAESREFIKEFTNSNYFIEKYAVDVPNDVDYYIEHGKASIALVVAPGFRVAILNWIAHGGEGQATPWYLKLGSSVSATISPA
mgnify:CR=1 FL=1